MGPLYFKTKPMTDKEQELEDLYQAWKAARLGILFGMSPLRAHHLTRTEDLDPSQYEVIEDKQKQIEAPKNDL